MFRRNKRAGQITLELGLAFVCVVILLLASVKACVWIVARMTVRQEDFTNSRIRASSSPNLGEEVNESDTNKYPDLRIFN